MPTPLPSSTPSFDFCDANKNGTVDTNDGVFVKGCWNKPATGECQKVDLNNDGKVGIDDLQKFSYQCAQIFATPAPKVTSPGVKPVIKTAPKPLKRVKGISAEGNVGIGWTGPTFKYAENPTDLDAAAYTPYFAPPTPNGG